MEACMMSEPVNSLVLRAKISLKSYNKLQNLSNMSGDSLSHFNSNFMSCKISSLFRLGLLACPVFWTPHPLEHQQLGVAAVRGSVKLKLTAFSFVLYILYRKGSLSDTLSVCLLFDTQQVPSPLNNFAVLVL